MRVKTLLLIIISIVTHSCSSSNKIRTPKPLDKEWTLEASPNGLDNVGVVFAIDSSGSVIRIPGGDLSLATVSSPIVITQQTKTKNVSIGAIANFLAIKNIDSSTRFNINDSSHLNATFKINSGKITAIGNDTISAKFRAKYRLIVDNIKSLNLENSKLYLILETIRSSNVNITFDRTTQTSTSIVGKLKALIGIDTHFKSDKTKNSDLVYNGQDTLTVFYKLRSIDINVIGIKGTGNEKVDITLGKVINSSEIIIPKSKE